MSDLPAGWFDFADLSGTPRFSWQDDVAIEDAIVHAGVAHDVAIVREVLIESTDMVAPGEEPYVGWSLVLAERIVKALNP